MNFILLLFVIECVNSQNSKNSVNLKLEKFKSLKIF